MTLSQVHALFEFLDQGGKMGDIYDAYGLTLAECEKIRGLVEGKSPAELRQLEHEVLGKKEC
jgi:hypothetical protein